MTTTGNNYNTFPPISDAGLGRRKQAQHIGKVVFNIPIYPVLSLIDTLLGGYKYICSFNTEFRSLINFSPSIVPQNVFFWSEHLLSLHL